MRDIPCGGRDGLFLYISPARKIMAERFLIISRKVKLCESPAEPGGGVQILITATGEK
jgi:hypothetical protein